MKLYRAIAAVIFLSPIAYQAQLFANMDKDCKKMEEKMEMRNKKHLEMLTKKLNLSTDQQTAVKAALDEKNTKMKTLHEEFFEKRKAIAEETNTKINAILNEDQKTKYGSMKSDMKMKHDMEHNHP